MTSAEKIDSLLSYSGETRELEFKRLGDSRGAVIEKTLESIVAMSNTDGGVIVLGIDDPEKTTKKGLERVYGIEENLELFDELGRCVKKILPPLSLIWPPELIPVASKRFRVAIIFVPKATDGLRAYENHVFIRQEKGNMRLSPQEIIHFAYIKGFERSDIELVEVPIHLLDTPFYSSWRKNRSLNADPISEVLEKTGLIRRNDQGVLKPTRAAVLLFAEHPNDLMDTKCTVRVFQYHGKRETIKETINLLGAPKTIDGPIIKQIRDAHEYVLTLLRSGIRVPSGFVTRYKVPERAVKEAITNAIIHRDYYTKRDIEIRIFENRIEIESPGLLPFNITPSNIGVERAKGYRNDLLVKHLREFPDPPNLDQNEGVRAMRQTMASANLYPPIFATYPEPRDAVRVKLLNEIAPDEWEKVCHHLKGTKYINNRIAREILGIESEGKVSKFFGKWSKQGLLVKIVPRTGAKKNVSYRLPTADEKSLFAKGKSR